MSNPKKEKLQEFLIGKEYILTNSRLENAEKFIEEIRDFGKEVADE